MNCEHLQEKLYDYLDDTLSSPEKAAAQEHLRACESCRQNVERELQLARTLSNRLSQAVEPVALDANAQRGMAIAVQRSFQTSPQRFSFAFWRRLAMPIAAAAVLLLAAIWLGHHFISQSTSRANTLISSAAGDRVVPIHVSFSITQYTFHKDGFLVVDALTHDTRSADGALLVKK